MYRSFLKVRKLKVIEHLLPIPSFLSTTTALNKEFKRKKPLPLQEAA